MQTGLFDLEFRLDKIDANGDPLKKLGALIDWESFRSTLEAARDKDKERKSSAGRKPFDAVPMFKILILQSLYGLSDDAAEYQILDRLSFMRFLGLKQGDAVPDAKTIWLFRDMLTSAEAIDPLFDRFDTYLRKRGFAARVEHVFGIMSRRGGGKLVRAVGWARTRMKIGLRNLAYNLDRYAMLVQKGG
jgi:hypothetical protein